MDDALLNIGGVNIRNAKLRCVTFQCFQLLCAFGVSNRDIIPVAVQACRSWKIVVRHGQSQVWSPYTASGNAQAFKSLWTRDLVNQMAINEDQACSVAALLHDMGIPDFFVQCLRC